jgi:hypothetical protein
VRGHIKGREKFDFRQYRQIVEYPVEKKSDPSGDTQILVERLQVLLQKFFDFDPLIKRFE